MFLPIEQLHVISTKQNIDQAPEKSLFMLLEAKFLGHEIGYNTIKPINSKVAAIRKLLPPALMSFVGAPNFYTKFIEKRHINIKPFYDLLHENTPWSWTTEHETLFHKLKNALTSDTEITIPNTKHPFFITVDTSLIGLLGIVHALQVCEFLIIGFPYPIHIFTDHKHLLHCFTKKETLVHVFIVLKCNSQISQN